MDFPDPVRLMPGMAYSLRISFQPIKLEACRDIVEVIVAGSAFPVYLEALLPIVRLEVPTNIDFGLCSVSEVCFTRLSWFAPQSECFSDTKDDMT
jgi:cilia- and flagella-associated protein 65